MKVQYTPVSIPSPFALSVYRRLDQFSFTSPSSSAWQSQHIAPSNNGISIPTETLSSGTVTDDQDWGPNNLGVTGTPMVQDVQAGAEALALGAIQKEGQCYPVSSFTPFRLTYNCSSGNPENNLHVPLRQAFIINRNSRRAFHEQIRLLSPSVGWQSMGKFLLSTM
jgi:hypothetical protein